MIGVDTRFLVALALRQHPGHRRCRELFEREIVGQPGSMAIAPQALAEFSHVVSEPRRFENPLEMADALEVCEQWWRLVECHPVDIDADAAPLFLSWMRRFELGRKRLLDTMLAAVYYCAGVKRLATMEWRDFAGYEVFGIVPV